MKSYLSLIPISAKVHRRQSRMTRICIILAVFLVTSIFSMAEMWTKGQTTSMRNKHGDWHIALQNMSEDDAVQISNSPEVAFTSWYNEINQEVNQGYYISGKNAVLYGIEETYAASIMKYPAEGSFPQSEKEIVLSASAKELFGVKIGDNITLNTPAGDVLYTISGFYEDDAKFNHIIDGICVYMDRGSFDEICRLNGTESDSWLYIRFAEERGLKKTIANTMRQYGLNAENIEENKGLLGILGASSNQTMNELYPLAAVCFLIILISGIFMISSCMNSNVAQRTSFFGMMRCIGASKQQIIRFVRLEALNWCKTAIPTGCALGTVICWVLCAVLRFVVKGEWANMPLFAVSMVGILSGAVVGVVTVFIAAHSPAKWAAKVSPAVAVSGNMEISRHVGHGAGTRFFKVETSLGIHHAIGAKKNLFLMTGSFALTIILFLAFAACLDLVHRLLPSVSRFTPDITISSEDESNSVSRNLVDEIVEIPGVETAFGTFTHTAYPIEINGSPETVDLFSYSKYMLDSVKKFIINGDPSKIYGDSGYVLAVYDQAGSLNVGDRIKIGEEELEIACIVSFGVGSVSGAAPIVCSEETYMRLTGEQNYTMISVMLENGVSETAVSKIRDLAGSYSFADNREENNETYGSYWVSRLAAYGFLAIVTLIAVLNIVNSISMSVSARTRQYGAMRAVGMESWQVTKMIAAEAAAYAASGTAVGIILGLLFHYLIYKKMIISHFGGKWNIPITSIGIILLLVIASCALAVQIPARRMRDMAVVDTINEL